MAAPAPDPWVQANNSLQATLNSPSYGVPGAAPAAPKPAAPAAAPNPMGGPVAPPSAMSAYGNAQAPNYQAAFQQALNHARGNINAQLGAALGDIANSQQQAGIALGQMPGMINSAFGQEQGNEQSALAGLQGAMSKAGIGGGMNLSAMMAPEMSAEANTRGADMANVPLLQAGMTEAADRARTQADLAALNANSQLDQGQMQYDQNMAGNQQQQGYNAANAYQQYLYSRSLNDQQDKASAAGQAPTTGNAVNGLTSQQVDTIRQSPAYRNIANMIQSGGNLQNFLAGTFGDKVRGNQALQNVLMTDFKLKPGAFALPPGQK